MQGNWEMVRFENYKYVRLLHQRAKKIVGGKEQVFYDLKADPGEQKDLSASNEYSAKLEEAKALLAEWKKKTQESAGPPKIIKRPAKGKDESANDQE
jgi:arylsulfatase A-like enzyme